MPPDSGPGPPVVSQRSAVTAPRVKLLPIGLQEASWASRISRCVAACDRHRGLLAVHAGDPTHHEHRTGDNSGPGDPGIPVDLQTSGDQVLLDLAELNFAEAEFAALR